MNKLLYSVAIVAALVVLTAPAFAANLVNVSGTVQVDRLLRQLIVTRDHELNCNEWFAKMPEFAERELSGKDVLKVLQAVQNHLTLCGECSEECAALLNTLQSMEERENTL